MKKAQQLLGIGIEELMASPSALVRENPDFVDEDETDVHTQRWFLTHEGFPDLEIFTDDRVVRMLWIRKEDAVTDRGIRVGSTLSEVKLAYPESIFPNGSTDVVSRSLFLYAEDGRVLFVFYDRKVSNLLLGGQSFQFDDPEVRDVKLHSVSFSNENMKARVEGRK